MNNPFRIGERAYLRPIDAEDAPFLQRWVNDPDVNRYLGSYLPVNGARERDWVDGLYKEPDDVVLLIALKEGDRPIGCCGLHQKRHDRPARSAELGILIGEKDCQDRGYGGEAMRLLCEYGFNRLNLHRIGLRVYDYNRRAIRCYEKVGSLVEGMLRDGHRADGEWHDVVMMGLLEHEFRADGLKAAALCQRNAI